MNKLIWRIAFTTLLLLLPVSPAAPVAENRPAPLPKPVAAPAAAPNTGLQGSQPFLTILCKLADVDGEPAPRSHFADLLLGPSPSLDDYWREVSHGKINLEGSQVTEWHTLEGETETYRQPDGEVDLKRLATSCLQAASDEVKAGVFAAFNLVFNVDFDFRPYAGTVCMEESGETVCRQVTWMWPAQVHSLAFWAHEIGHVFGLAHSPDAEGRPYANAWTVMSDSASCKAGETRGSMPQHISSSEKDRLGWIPAGRKFTMSQSGTATIRLQRQALPSGDGYLSAVIPWGDTTGGHYVVEARKRAGYDVHLPGDAVIIYAVDPNAPDNLTRLVSHPGETDQNAASVAWTPGSSFVDAERAIAVTVDRDFETGFVVTLRTGDDAVQFTPAREDRPAGAKMQQTEFPLGMTGANGLSMVLRENTPHFAWAQQDHFSNKSSLHLCSGGTSRGSNGGGFDYCWSHPSGDRLSVVGGRGGDIHLAWAGPVQSASAPAMRYTSASEIWVARGDPETLREEPRTIVQDALHMSKTNPVLAADADGRLYAAWIEQKTRGADVAFARVSEMDEGTVTERINDQADTVWRASPALVASANGDIHAAWIDARSGHDRVYTAHRRAEGEWGPNEPLSTSEIDAEAAPALSVDEAGNLYATWVSYSACGSGNGALGRIMSGMRSPGGSWQPASVVSAHVNGGRESRPVIAVGVGGVAYVAWEEYEGGDVALYLARRAPGDAWSPAMRIARTGTRQLDRPALVMDEAGGVILAWLAGDSTGSRIVYAHIS